MACGTLELEQGDVFMKNLGMLLAVFLSVFQIQCARAPHYIDDVHRLNKTKVRCVVTPTSVQDLVRAVCRAAQENIKVSIAGGRHSQGGQVFVRHGMVIDITQLKRIGALDGDQKTVTVEPGVTWKELQEYINPHGLALKVMQHYNNFTVGGSLAVNAHGLDCVGSIIHVVKKIKVLLADGSVVTASRTENNELFKHVIGGYGLFGIVVEATIQLTDNVFLDADVREMPIDQYEKYFLEQVRNDPTLELHYAEVRPPTKLRKTVSLLSLTYRKSDDHGPGSNIKNQKLLNYYEPVNDMAFDMFKSSEVLQELAFACRKYGIKKRYQTRNNAMRTSAHIFKSNKSVNILQEYFVPVGKLSRFIDAVHVLVKKNNMNFLGNVIRFVPQDKESALSYARQDSFSVVLLVNHRRNVRDFAKMRRFTREIIDTALEDCGGSFYLVAQPYATKEQIKKAYPTCTEHADVKKHYDSQGLFENSMSSLLYDTTEGIEDERVCRVLDKLDPQKPITILVHGTRLPPPLLLIPGLAQQVMTPPGIYHADDVSSFYFYKRVALQLARFNKDFFPEESLCLYGWSGELSMSARKRAAEGLYNFIKSLRSDVRYQHTPVTVITVSHGGNVALSLAAVAMEHKDTTLLVNKLILLACPIQEQTKGGAQSPIFGMVYNLYSRGDLIQLADPQGLQGASCLFSQRRLDKGHSLFNIEIRRRRRGSLGHIEFVTQAFLKNISVIVNQAQKQTDGDSLCFDIRGATFVMPNSRR